MWGKCRAERVVAITYDGIRNVDLRLYSRENPPPGWNQLRGSAIGSMAHFAWDIRGGDAIYVGDSDSHQMVGMGYATAHIGDVAYRFEAGSPITPAGGEPWFHLIDMDWDPSFVPFVYRDRAPQNTVLPLRQGETENLDRRMKAQEHRDNGLGEDEVQDALLLEGQYTRYTSAALRVIRRKHVALSNRFRSWLELTHRVRALQERQQIDATFEAGGQTFLTEFKIAYQGNTKRAIREALGQILEYNHYPPRVSRDHWLLVLDIAPCHEDRLFLQDLRDRFRIPLSLGWETGSAFLFEPPLVL